MKTFSISLICVIGLFVMTSCTEKELTLPASIVEQEDGVIDLIAKPIDVEFVAEYDYGYTIKWPTLSEKIKKMVVTYTDKDNSTKKFEFTNFMKDTSFFVQSYDEYAFNVQAFGDDGKESRVAVIKAWNKDLYARQLLNEAQISQFGKFIRLRWSNALLKELRMTIKNSIVNQTAELKGLSGEQLIPIKDDGTADLSISLLDKSTNLEGTKTFAFRPQGINLSRADKSKWTIYYDSPFNEQAWWHIGEAFDGEYTLNADLDGTGKLNAVAIPEVSKLNSDRRIRTLYFTFTQKTLNADWSWTTFNPSNRRPAGPYDNILVQKLTYVFKGQTGNSDRSHDAVFPDALRIYGIKADGTEILVARVYDVANKFIKYQDSDPNYIKSIAVDIPQVTFDGATFRGIKTEFLTNSLPNNTDSWDPQNNIGVGEIFVRGIKVSI
ncbi:hypothetical protein [Sphingobacterium composti Ten et al. 2007 non Yoo et al. 2007]|uniref:hypothetical protein n=1 Tax=Sphingobacterium composti TaxID=363260 RepID=UPI00135C652F|nr:hypothetical protein [Sphingobacterium composti Ten et al. 2007 non Yoo et al. 2007]